MTSRQSFTLIELLIVIAIVAVLAVTVILTLNPSQLVKQARDSTRLSDLATINQALSIYQADQISSNLGSSSVLYISIPDPTATTTQGTNCQGISGLTTSSLPSGWTWHCPASSTARNTDGTGWIPVNFSQISAGSPISNLPIDPINTTSSGNYYAYTIGSSSPSVWLISSLPESQKHKTTTSNPINLDGVFLTGNDYTISPIYNTQGLVGWWKFDEGSGSSTKDWSGNGNDGTITGNAVLATNGGRSAILCNSTTGNVNLGAGKFDSLSNATVSLWINPQNSGNRTVFVHGANTWWDSDNTFAFLLDSATRMFVSTRKVGSPTPVVISLLQNGSWAHVVGMCGQSGLKVYKDGALIQSNSTTTCFADMGPSNYNFICNVKAGYIDDVRIYNRVLSAAEIQAIYNATK